MIKLLFIVGPTEGEDILFGLLNFEFENFLLSFVFLIDVGSIGQVFSAHIDIKMRIECGSYKFLQLFDCDVLCVFECNVSVMLILKRCGYEYFVEFLLCA